jgi:predicted ribosome quality control (RQC) complex YloA/Tae2 family protein
VYDVDKRNYIFKFGSSEDKLILHLEIGNRLHSAVTEVEKKVVPSGLTMKLRKKLKGKRLESCKPVGVERVLEMVFGSGELEVKLYLEFYSKGNMILTDKDLVIIAVTRSHSYDENNQ